MSAPETVAIVFTVRARDRGGWELVATGVWPTRRDGAWAVALDKWQVMVAALGRGLWPIRDGGAKTCALCRVYETATGGLDCRSCMGEPYIGCLGTPYWDYVDAVFANDPVAGLNAAERELAFLETLSRGEKP